MKKFLNEALKGFIIIVITTVVCLLIPLVIELIGVFADNYPVLCIITVIIMFSILIGYAINDE